MTRFEEASLALAQCIYYARASLYAIAGPHWDALDAYTRQIYTRQAEDMLRANRPSEIGPLLFSEFVAETRAHAAKVVGRIDPDPDLWGV